MKDFMLRSFMCMDEPWWAKTLSPWKITLTHPTHEPDEYAPTYWEDRVLNLLSFDITYSTFGLSYLDLMELDPATFERIEAKVHEVAEKQADAVPKELKKEWEKTRKGLNNGR